MRSTHGANEEVVLELEEDKRGAHAEGVWEGGAQAVVAELEDAEARELPEGVTAHGVVRRGRVSTGW